MPDSRLALSCLEMYKGRSTNSLHIYTIAKYICVCFFLVFFKLVSILFLVLCFIYFYFYFVSFGLKNKQVSVIDVNTGEYFLFCAELPDTIVCETFAYFIRIVRKVCFILTSFWPRWGKDFWESEEYLEFCTLQLPVFSKCVHIKAKDIASFA